VSFTKEHILARIQEMEELGLTKLTDYARLKKFHEAHRHKGADDGI
jgi:hypothetical protein